MDKLKCTLVTEKVKLTRTLLRHPHTANLYVWAKIIRSLYLCLNRDFGYIQYCPGFSPSLEKLYRNAVNHHYKLLWRIKFSGGGATEATSRYLHKVINNICIFQELCIWADKQQYTKLPGNLPLDVRNHIVGYIAITPIQ